MGNDYLTDPLEFLIRTLINLYTFAVMLRWVLQQVRADFYHPISQLTVRITEPPLAVFRRIIPDIAALDTAAIVLMILLQMLAWTLIGALAGTMPSAMALLALSLAELVSMAVSLLFFSILIQTVLSWFNADRHPAVVLLHSINAPLLRPVRRRLPINSRLDFSPLIVLLGLKILEMLLVPLLLALAR